MIGGQLGSIFQNYKFIYVPLIPAIPYLAIFPIDILSSVQLNTGTRFVLANDQG